MVATAEKRFTSTIMTDVPLGADNLTPPQQEVENVSKEKREHVEVVNTFGQAMEVFEHAVKISKKEPLSLLSKVPALLKVRSLITDLAEVNDLEAGVYPPGSGLLKGVLNLGQQLPPQLRSEMATVVDEPAKAGILRGALLKELRQEVGQFLLENKIPPVAEPPKYLFAALSDPLEDLLNLEQKYADLMHDVGTSLTNAPGAAFWANHRDPEKRDLALATTLASESVESLDDVLKDAPEELKDQYTKKPLTIRQLFRRLTTGFNASLLINKIKLNIVEPDAQVFDKTVGWSTSHWGRLLSNEKQNFIRDGSITEVEVSAGVVNIEGVDCAEIKFRDNGKKGYPREILDDQFRNSITIREDNSGTGRGMRAQQEAIGKFDGVLIARNPEEGGAELTVRLPLYKN